MFIKANGYIELFRTSNFFLVILSINESGTIASPTIIAELSFSPFNSVNVCFIYFRDLVFGAYIFIIVKLFGELILYGYIISFYPLCKYFI